MRTLIRYKAYKITKAQTALAPATGMRPFSETAASHLMFNFTLNVFEVLSVYEGDFALTS